MSNGPSRGRIVGRDPELARVLALADDPETGAILITGPVGIGRSRLAEAAHDALVERGWRGVAIAATESATGIRYAALSELVPKALDEVTWAPEDRDADRIVLRGIEEALELDTGRVVVVVSDIDDIDPASGDLLVHLAGNRRLLLIADAVDGARLDAARARLALAGMHEIELGPLDSAGTAALATAVLGAPVGPGLVRALLATAEGRPAYVRELLDHARSVGAIESIEGTIQLVGELPMSDVLGRRITLGLGVLSGAERRALELLAIAGELGADELVAWCGIEVVEALEQRRLVATELHGRRVRARIAHRLHAAAILSQLSALASRRRHRELAELLADRPSRRPLDLPLVASIRLGAGEVLEPAVLVDAARAALRTDRIDVADRLSLAAVEQLDDELTCTARADTLIRQGRFAEADRLLAVEPDACSDWARAHRAIRRASNQLWGFGDAAAAERIDQAVLTELTERDPRDRVVAHRAWVALCDGRPADAVALTDDLVDRDDPEVRFAVAVARALGLVLTGPVESGVRLAWRAWEEEWGAGVEIGSHGQHLIAVGFGALYLGDLPRARALADAAIQGCRERGEMNPLLFLLDLAGNVELTAGRLRDALGCFEEALRLAGELALASSIRSSIAAIATIRAQLGDRAGAEHALAQLTDVPDAAGPRGGIDVRAAAGWVAAVGADRAAGAGQLRAAADAADARGLVVPSALLRLDLARLGHVTRADAVAASAAAGRAGGPLLGAVAEAVHGVADADPDRVAAAAVTFGELGCVLWAAELAGAAAELFSARSQRREAVRWQRHAEEYGQAVPDRTATMFRVHAVEPLTRREREIATLAATGARNSEIAARLHLSVRTVETHLQRVYRKAGVRNRQELVQLVETG